MSRNVVITGVLGGIGSATAQLFQSHGWFVIGIDLPDISHLPKGVDLFVSADVSNEDHWQNAVQTVSGAVESIHALINNAAVQICKPLIEMPSDEWDHLMAVNLKSVFLSLKALHPLMETAQTAAIVNVSSVHALATSTQIAAYAASKGGVLALTRAMALELGTQIRVNALLPGAVDTPMLRAGLNRGHVEGESVDELVSALGKKHVVGKVGQPKEIAEAIYFLADSNRSSFVTGQALVIDGGATIRLSTE